MELPVPIRVEGEQEARAVACAAGRAVLVELDGGKILRMSPSGKFKDLTLAFRQAREILGRGQLPLTVYGDSDGAQKAAEPARKSK